MLTRIWRRQVLLVLALAGTLVAASAATALAGTGFTYGQVDLNGNCQSKEDPAGLVYTNLHVSRNGGNTYGVNAAVDIASKLWNGGHGSSGSYYPLSTGVCHQQTDWVTQSGALLNEYGYHERFWQEVNQKVISASHHDQPCSGGNDSANDYNSSRDLMAQFFNNFQDTHGNFPFTYTTTDDRTPTDWYKCGTRYHVSDDGKTRRVNQTIGTAYIN